MVVLTIVEFVMSHKMVSKYKRIFIIILSLICFLTLFFFIYWIAVYRPPIFFSSFRKFPYPPPSFVQPSTQLNEATSTKITIEIWNGKIQPNRLTLKAGQEIFLTIVSMEGKHSIVFEGPGLSWLHANFDEPGETLQFHLFAPAQGEYHFFCQEPNHRESGEEGVIIVE
jgi:Plastocyanin